MKGSLVVRAILSAVAIATTAAWVEARGDDVIGVVRSVDAKGKTFIITDSKTKQDMHVHVGDQTRIGTGDADPQHPTALTFARIVPGAKVSVNDAVVASSINVFNERVGTVIAIKGDRLTLSEISTGKKLELLLNDATDLKAATPELQGILPAKTSELTTGSRVIAIIGPDGRVTKLVVEYMPGSILAEFSDNFRHNLFKPLLLFFYAGFLVPILRVKFEFPYVIYQALTIYLLIAIGWKGGEELAELEFSEVKNAVGFMGVGFVTNIMIGILAYFFLSLMTRMRRIDKATVAGYYGSDSAGTFVTCVGVLTTAGIAHEAYMPVMLAVMEIPGCLVALYLVSRLRNAGMDPLGNMPNELGYNPTAKRPLPIIDSNGEVHEDAAVLEEAAMALETTSFDDVMPDRAVNNKGLLDPKLLHEVFLNPGLYLLFGGILIGLLSGIQGKAVTRADDSFFVDLFQGILCLFLLEMGMTASRKLLDLRTAGIGFVFFALLAPNLFATVGILVAHSYSLMTETPLLLGTYVLFAVLCGAASYIAVPAVQRLAIPEASPTLPLAASLGLTFSYNVTIGIPIYIEIAKAVMRYV